MTLRILVVEDEMTIAMLLEDMLIDMGYEVAGLAMRLPQAMELASTAELDLALLDVNLDGRVSFPVADVLQSRGLPFIFCTGYGRAGIIPAYADRTVLSKPFLMSDLENAIEAVTAQSRPPEPAGSPAGGGGSAPASRA